MRTEIGALVAMLPAASRATLVSVYEPAAAVVVSHVKINPYGERVAAEQRVIVVHAGRVEFDGGYGGVVGRLGVEDGTSAQRRVGRWNDDLNA